VKGLDKEKKNVKVDIDGNGAEPAVLRER